MRFLILLLFTSVALGGPRTHEIPRVLEDVSAIREIELYSIYPEPRTLDIDTAKSTENYPKLPKFHEWPIFGQAKIDDHAEIEEIMAALHSAIRDEEGKLINCFEPQHALRLHFVDKSICDVVICFHCQKLELYRKGEKERFDFAFIGPKMGERFDGFLRKHNLRLATKKL